MLYGCAVPEPAQPIAGAQWGRWRFCTAPPEVGKTSGLFRQSPTEALALWLSVPETAQPIAGALWGHRRFRITPPEMEAMP